MLCDEDCRAAGFGKTERPVGREGNGETSCKTNEALHLRNLSVTDRLLLPMPNHSFTLDYALFSNDRGFLEHCRKEIEAYLATLRLRIHPIKSQLIQTRYAASFVGFRVLPDRIRVRNHNLQTGRRRLKQLQAAYGKGQISEHDFTQRFQSWNAHLSRVNTWRLRQYIFHNIKLPHPLK